MRRLCLCLAATFLLFVIAAPALRAQSPPWTGVVSADRAINWGEAGVSGYPYGAVPSAAWTQCGATIAAYGTSSSPASPATIQTAITTCTPGGNGGNTYIQLGSGNFYLSGSFYVKGAQNFEIRMSPTTTIHFYGSTGAGGDNCGGIYASICFESADVNYTASPSNVENWTAGYTQGTTVVTLAAVPNLKIGNPIIFDQLIDTTDAGSYLEQQATTNGNPYTSPGSPGPYSGQGGQVRTGRGLTHQYTVVGCNGSTTIGASCSGTNVAVTIDPPLEEPNWNSSLSPQAWWATYPSRNVGVQFGNVDDTNTGCTGGNSMGVGFFNVVNGWAIGMGDVNECLAHVAAYYANRLTVENGYWFLARYSTSESYGFSGYVTDDSLIQNNISQAIAGAVILQEGSVGNVIFGNFEINGYYQSSGYVISWANTHGIGNDLNLFEENIGSRFGIDAIHGTGNMNAFDRNLATATNVVCWISGPQSNPPVLSDYLGASWGTCTNGLQAVQNDSFHRFNNWLGNVLGTTGINTAYQNTMGAVYSIGQGYTDGVTNVTVPADSTVAQTMFRWGNCDPTNGGAGGTPFTSCQFNSSEVPTTGTLATSQQPYAQTVPGSHTLPASFYYTSRPTWWPASKPWPAIGPDVTGGNISGVNGLAYTNPAEDCYNSLSGSTSNGTGGPFPFDANTCYAAIAPAPPAPATMFVIKILTEELNEAKNAIPDDLFGARVPRGLYQEGGSKPASAAAERGPFDSGGVDAEFRQ